MTGGASGSGSGSGSGFGSDATALDVEPFAVDLARPLSTARGTIERREGFLVRATVDGVRGVGEATPLSGWTESRAACRAALERAVDADGTVDDALRAAEGDDPAPAARHGLHLAVADARARAAGEPLARRLAGDASPAASVPVNATVGDGPVDETVDAAVAAAEAGYPAVKLKVGVRDVDADVERVRAVLAAVDGATVRADANGAWDRATAARAVETLADPSPKASAGADSTAGAGGTGGQSGLEYLEQPLPADDLDGLADLRDRGVPIAVDESLSGAGPGARAVLDAGAADVLVAKPTALGGVDRVAALARRAGAAGVDVVVTTTVDAAVARAGAIHLAAALPGGRPCGLATADLLAADVLPDPAPVAAGAVPVPEGPGLGAAFDGLRGGSGHANATGNANAGGSGSGSGNDG